MCRRILIAAAAKAGGFTVEFEREMAAFAGELGLHAQTLIAEEVDPRFSCLIRLWIRADVIVVIESKGGAG